MNAEQVSNSELVARRSCEILCEALGILEGVKHQRGRSADKYLLRAIVEVRAAIAADIVDDTEGRNAALQQVWAQIIAEEMALHGVAGTKLALDALIEVTQKMRDYRYLLTVMDAGVVGGSPLDEVSCLSADTFDSEDTRLREQITVLRTKAEQLSAVQNLLEILHGRR